MCNTMFCVVVSMLFGLDDFNSHSIISTNQNIEKWSGVLLVFFEEAFATCVSLEITPMKNEINSGK